jgi:hypothetical protein
VSNLAGGDIEDNEIVALHWTGGPGPKGPIYAPGIALLNAGGGRPGKQLIAGNLCADCADGIQGQNIAVATFLENTPFSNTHDGLDLINARYCTV